MYLNQASLKNLVAFFWLIDKNRKNVVFLIRIQIFYNDFHEKKNRIILHSKNKESMIVSLNRQNPCIFD